jgi:hypothetical protein
LLNLGSGPSFFVCFPVAPSPYNSRAPFLDCHFLPSHQPLLDIALASSLRPPSRLWLPFIPSIFHLGHQHSLHRRRTGLSPAKTILLYFTFLFLLTRFVAYLLYRVGLCSYKYPRLASLKSGQFDPFLLSPCVILSMLDRPATTRANAPSLVFSSRRPKYALATCRFQSGAAHTSTPSRTFPTSECGLGSYFSPSISISELTRRLTTSVLQ